MTADPFALDVVVFLILLAVCALVAVAAIVALFAPLPHTKETPHA